MENKKNIDNGSKTVMIDIQKQKNEWRKKGWSIGINVQAGEMDQQFRMPAELQKA